MKEIDRLEESHINEVFNKATKTFAVREDMDKYVQHMIKLNKKMPKTQLRLRFIQFGHQLKEF